LTVELAILFPAFVVLLFIGIQAALWYHARNVALAAAQAGYRAARPIGATGAAGEKSAREFLTRQGDNALSAPAVTATTTTTSVRIDVTGDAPRVLPLPGLHFRIEQVAVGPKEHMSQP